MIHQSKNPGIANLWQSCVSVLIYILRHIGLSSMRHIGCLQFIYQLYAKYYFHEFALWRCYHVHLRHFPTSLHSGSSLRDQQRHKKYNPLRLLPFVCQWRRYIYLSYIIFHFYLSCTHLSACWMVIPFSISIFLRQSQKHLGKFPCK